MENMNLSGNQTKWVIFKMTFVRTLLTEFLGGSVYSGDFRSIRWKQIRSVALLLCRLSSYILQVELDSIACKDLMDFSDCKTKVGMFGAVEHEITNETRQLLEVSIYLLLLSLTDKRKGKCSDDLFSKKKVPNNIQVEIEKLSTEFLSKNCNINIANPIQFIGETPGSDFLITGRFIRPDASVNSDPVPISIAGEIDTICKSKRFFMLKRRGEKSIRVNYDFFTQFLGICDSYRTSDSYTFNLLAEQDALRRNTYYTLENIGEKTGGNLSFDF